MLLKCVINRNSKMLLVVAIHFGPSRLNGCKSSSINLPQREAGHFLYLPPVWNLWDVITFLSALLLFCLVSTCSFYLLIVLLLAHSPACFPEISFKFFFSRYTFWPLFLILFKWLGDENEPVICAACCLTALVFG